MKICEYYNQLKDLGSPGSIVCEGLKCSDVELALRTLQDVQDHRDKWVDLVLSLYHQFEWLLFFRMPKIMRLYNHLKNEDPSSHSNEIAREICFLSEDRISLRNKVQVNNLIYYYISLQSLYKPDHEAMY